MTDDLPIRDPDQIRQDCARKLRVVQVSDHFQAILGCLFDEDWTTPRLVEMVITADGGMRFSSRDVRPPNPRRNIHCASKANGIAHQKIVAGLGAMSIISPPSLIPSTSSMKNCLNGEGRLTPQLSEAKKATKEMKKVK